MTQQHPAVGSLEFGICIGKVFTYVTKRHGAEYRI